MKKKRTLKRKTFLRTGMGENCFGSVQIAPNKKRVPTEQKLFFIYNEK